MGGKALKNHTSCRLTKSNYTKVSQHCLDRLRLSFPNNKIEIIGSYHSKADFGDCDILIENTIDHTVNISKVLNSVEDVKNGTVTSYGIETDNIIGHAGIFQVDLIKISPESFEFAKNYFGSGDAGNLIGRIAHKMGLSFGHDGLKYYFNDGDNRFSEYMLTKDFSKALESIGYDSTVFMKGFNTKLDIYEYITQNQFFNKNIYLLENRNYIARVRDKKRPMYMDFLKWCQNKTNLNEYDFPSDKKYFLDRIFHYFPDFIEVYNKTIQSLEESKKVKEKFNGSLVMDLTGLANKKLGEFMSYIKNSEENLNQTILNMEDNEIIGFILEKHDEYKKGER